MRVSVCVCESVCECVCVCVSVCTQTCQTSNMQKLCSRNYFGHYLQHPKTVSFLHKLQVTEALLQLSLDPILLFKGQFWSSENSAGA